MQVVRCISPRESKPNQLELGRLYWIDENTKYTDSDGDEYVTVFADANREREVGVLLTSHFGTDYKYMRYGMSLSIYVNDTMGNLLEDIIYWCNDVLSRGEHNSLAKNVMKYIKEHSLDKPDNMQREFFVKSKPFKEFEKEGNPDGYMCYMGYSVVQRE